MNWTSIWNETFVEFPGIECNKQWAHTRRSCKGAGAHKCLTSFYIIGTNWGRDVTSQMKKQKKNPHSHRYTESVALG